ncbi:MAG: hypothetical protein QNJ45_15090 [Ardenticatenaceae bacterium]|nr:hypothetical protein [Ardenticatenaceae bacterium]
MKLTFSPDQMAELPKTPPTLPRLGRRSSAPFWITIVAVVVPGLFLRWATTPKLALVPWWIDLLHVPVVLVGGLFISILLHEMGHLLFALGSGLRVVYIVVGPLKISRTARGWRLLSSGLTGFAIQGRVLAVPPERLWGDRSRLRRALFWFFAGGPAITLLQTAVVGALLFLTPDRTFNHISRGSLSAFFLLSTMMLGWVIYPLTINGIPNDVMQIIRLRRNDLKTRRLISLLVLQGQLIAGVRPSDLDDVALAQALMVQDGTADEITARLLAIARAEDDGQIEQVGERLSELLEEMHEVPPQKRSAPIMWQAAFFEAVHGQDVTAAQQWMTQAAKAQTAPVVESWLLQFMADLGIAVAREEWDEAADHAAQLSLLLDFTHSPGASMPVRSWLDGLPLPPPRTPPLKPWQFAWRPILFSILLTFLVIVAVTFLLVIVIMR